MNEVTIIIPAFRPQRDEIERAVRAVIDQSARGLIREVLLVDNNSPPGWYDSFNLPADPVLRVVTEPTPGLTPNRLRGFREVGAASEWVILVDQDNVLAPDYVEQALRLMKQFPHLGAIGGQISPEYETGPPPFAERAPSVLSLRKVTAPIWSNDPKHDASTPWGAGMFLRKAVTDAYVKKVENDPRRAFLDHRGTELLFGGDNDLANTSCDLGMGKGVFPELQLTHLIPGSRCTWAYFRRSVEGRVLSSVIRDYLSHGHVPDRPTVMELLRRLRGLISPDPYTRLSAIAEAAGKRRARKILQSQDL